MNQDLYPSFPILMVDDDPAWLRALEATLKNDGINHIVCCRDGDEALARVAKTPIAAMVLDLTMPGRDGEAIMKIMLRDYPDVPVIIITGTDDVQTAVRCMRAGAFNYFVKADNADNLVAGIHHALDIRDLKRENAQLRTSFLSGKLSRPEVFKDIVTCAPTMRSIFQYLDAVAQSPEPILIVGESGTGKEMIARAAHRLSGRTGNFVPVNIAAVDEHVMADTLFGHTRGAFTGAEGARKGLIEEAVGGTLFLDEVGDLSQESQVKLLRVLQEREYRPVGSDISKKVMTRVLAATNKTLEELRDSGKTRKDFFFRISAHIVTLPPLRERPEDLAPLLDHFLTEAASELGKKRPTPPPELLSLLRSYAFPGNVRELRSMVYDAVSRHHSHKLSMEAFEQRVFSGRGAPKAITAPNGAISESIAFGPELPSWKDATRLLIEEAMRRADNNQTLAAKMLKMNRQTLNKRLNGHAA